MAKTLGWQIADRKKENRCGDNAWQRLKTCLVKLLSLDIKLDKLCNKCNINFGFAPLIGKQCNNNWPDTASNRTILAAKQSSVLYYHFHSNENFGDNEKCHNITLSQTNAQQANKSLDACDSSNKTRPRLCVYKVYPRPGLDFIHKSPPSTLSLRNRMETKEVVTPLEINIRGQCDAVDISRLHKISFQQLAALSAV